MIGLKILKMVAHVTDEECSRFLELCGTHRDLYWHIMWREFEQ
jgi:hypothetical protein